MIYRLIPELLYLIIIIPAVYLLFSLNRTQKNFNRSMNELNRVSEIVRSYFFSLPFDLRVDSEITKYLEISASFIDHSSTKAITKSYEEITKKLIETFGSIIPELLQEEREEKLKELLK